MDSKALKRFLTASYKTGLIVQHTGTDFYLSDGCSLVRVPTSDRVARAFLEPLSPAVGTSYWYTKGVETKPGPDLKAALPTWIASAAEPLKLTDRARVFDSHDYVGRYLNAGEDFSVLVKCEYLDIFADTLTNGTRSFSRVAFKGSKGPWPAGAVIVYQNKLATFVNSHFDNREGHVSYGEVVGVIMPVVEKGS